MCSKKLTPVRNAEKVCCHVKGQDRPFLLPMVLPALILHNVESLERWLFLTLLSSCSLPSHLGSSRQGPLNYGRLRRYSRAGSSVVQFFCVGEPPKSYRTLDSASSSDLSKEPSQSSTRATLIIQPRLSRKIPMPRIIL